MTILQLDVEAILGRDLTVDEETRVDRLTAMAEAQVESLLPGFSIAAATATDEVIPWNDPDVMWTRRYPVTAVDSLEVDGNVVEASGYRWNELGEIQLLGGGRLNSWEVNLASFPANPVITVTYDYGVDPVAADIAAAVAAVVAALLRGQAAGSAGIASESLGAYSVTYDTAAAGSGGLAPPAADLLRRWKRTRQLSVPFVRTR